MKSPIPPIPDLDTVKRAPIMMYKFIDGLLECFERSQKGTLAYFYSSFALCILLGVRPTGAILLSHSSLTLRMAQKYTRYIYELVDISNSSSRRNKVAILADSFSSWFWMICFASMTHCFLRSGHS